MNGVLEEWVKQDSQIFGTKKQVKQTLDSAIVLIPVSAYDVEKQLREPYPSFADDYDLSSLFGEMPATTKLHY